MTKPATTNHPVRPDTVIISSACTACGLCLVTCPDDALVRAPKRPVVIDAACTTCGACIEVCPVGAITEVVASSGDHRG